ncbi:AAA-like domain-containing protein [Irpex lacteus]|nr:AAA-like domain-containing protein [Irpex lacteus]
MARSSTNPYTRTSTSSSPPRERASSKVSLDTDISDSGDSGFETSDIDDDEECALLNQTVNDSTDGADHELKTAPVFTRQAYLAAGGSEVFPQRGLLGALLEFSDNNIDSATNTDKRIYVNTNAPFSALVCGVQGSGKSHTVSVMLENMLIPGQASIGRLDKPLSGLVLHFGDGGADSQPSEAAYIGSTRSSNVAVPRIVVYVSPSSIESMRKMYKGINSRITVEPLQFSQEELDAKAFLSLMAVGSSESAPLYMQTVLSILRELGEKFNYKQFMDRLEEKKQSLNPVQLNGLKQRMELLQTFLDKSKKSTPPSRFAKGQLTIIDLSDIFIDPHSACGLFEIVTRLFVRAKLDTGKLLVVDEAHKYLSAHKRESGLTKELSSLVRQQRHLGMRVILSTQEPTVVPNTLIDLCSVVIMHRFSSPSWWDHLEKHVSANMTGDEAFDRVVRLKTGQAILLAPSGLSTCSTTTEGPRDYELYGRRWTLVKTRQRITRDGGASILVVGA